MAESFADIREPASASERMALAARFSDLRLRLAGATLGEVPGIALTQEELLNFAKAMSDEPEAKKLFCLE